MRVVTVATAIGRYAGPSPQEFVAQHGISMPVALDDADNRLACALGVYRYPTVYWVARAGRVRAVSEGEASDAALRHAFEAPLVASHTVPPQLDELRQATAPLLSCGVAHRIPIQPVGHRMLSRCSTLASIASCGFSATISKIVGEYTFAPRSIVAILSNATVPVPICAW